MPFARRLRAGDLAEISIPAQQRAVLQAAVRDVELRRVRYIERLRPELHPESLRDRECLENRSIQRPRWRTRLALQSEISSRQRSGGSEVRNVEILRRGSATGGRRVRIGAVHQIPR